MQGLGFDDVVAFDSRGISVDAIYHRLRMRGCHVASQHSIDDPGFIVWGLGTRGVGFVVTICLGST